MERMMVRCCEGMTLRPEAGARAGHRRAPCLRIPDLELLDAKRLVAGRDRAHFKDLGDAIQRVRQLVPQASENGLAVTTRYFSVDGTVSFGSAHVSARALVRRDPNRMEVIWLREGA